VQQTLGASTRPLDLAVAVGAPVVVTEPGPDAVNHATLALGAVDGQGLTAAVVTLDGPGAVLPVTPVGRFPHGSKHFSAAREWLDPGLHASAGRAEADTLLPLMAGVFVTISLATRK
jgi:hypothetical protein